MTLSIKRIAALFAILPIAASSAALAGDVYSDTTGINHEVYITNGSPSDYQSVEITGSNGLVDLYTDGAGNRTFAVSEGHYNTMQGTVRGRGNQLGLIQDGNGIKTRSDVAGAFNDVLIEAHRSGSRTDARIRGRFNSVHIQN